MGDITPELLIRRRDLLGGIPSDIENVVSQVRTCFPRKVNFTRGNRQLRALSASSRLR